MKLRDNQEKAVEIAINYFSSRRDKPGLMILPTAWGKSILIGWVANEIKEKVIVIQPSKELLEQNYFKYIALCKNELTASVYSASFNSKEISNVTFCTIGSIKSKGQEFRELGIKKVIIDEAHMFPREDSGMLKTFINDLSPTHVLGVTATPFKLQTNTDVNGNPFSKLVPLTNQSKKGPTFFKQVLYVGQIQEMIEKSYWSKLEYIEEEVNTEELILNQAKSEFTENSVEKVFQQNNIEYRVEEALKKLKKQYKCNHILIFVPSIDIAIRMQQKLKGGIVFSGMKSKDRDKNISDFLDGKHEHIFNVRILSTGFDYTKIDGIILGYPTASLTTYYQIIGRGTRIHPGKEKCYIYDLGLNYTRFGKIEDLEFVKLGDKWELISGNKLITSTAIHLLNTPFTLGFGKYKGIPLKDIPVQYLEWLLGNVPVDAYSKKQILLNILKKH